jgi:hypothetical protein
MDLAGGDPKLKRARDEVHSSDSEASSDTDDRAVKSGDMNRQCSARGDTVEAQAHVPST